MFIKNPYYSIKYFIQRGIRGYSDEDLWDFHSYLCDIISIGVKELAKNHYGCPGDLYDKTRKNDECWKWRETLETIIKGFEAAKELDRGCMIKKILKDGAYTMEFDKKKAQQLTKKFEEGMKLFAKHFMGLWD